MRTCLTDACFVMNGSLLVYFLLGQTKSRLRRIKDLEKQLWKERVDKKNLIRYYNIQT